MAGVPALAIPLGTHSSGLPIGIQIIAKQFDEATLLAFGKQLESNVIKLLS